MTSDISVNGTTVTSTGSSRIDDIYVKGVEHENGVQYTLTMNSTENGNTMPEVGTYQYNKGTVIPLIAQANTGWIFDNWSGDIQSNDNPTLLTIDNNYSITANFRVFISATINPTTGVYNSQDPVNPSTIIIWNDASSITSITMGLETLIENEDYIIADIDNETAQLTFIITEVPDNKESEYVINFNHGNNAHYFLTFVDQESYLLTFSIIDEDENEINDAVITLNEITYPVGHYNFGYLAVGDYDYKISRYGYITAEGTIEIVDKDEIVSIILEIAPSYKITFVVIYNNTPVEGASININQQIITTDNNGEASIFLSNGNYLYTVEKSGYETWESEIDVEDDEQTIEVGLKSGITSGSVPEKQEIKIYPNPVIDFITLERSERLNSTIEIYSVTGLLLNVLEWKEKSVQIDMNSYAHGVIFIKIRTNRHVDVFQLIKQ